MVLYKSYQNGSNIVLHPNGASLRVICMKNQMKTWAKNVIILHAKYNPNITWTSYADPS
jgi:hypothetical protein